MAKNERMNVKNNFRSWVCCYENRPPIPAPMLAPRGPPTSAPIPLAIAEKRPTLAAVKTFFDSFFSFSSFCNRISF